MTIMMRTPVSKRVKAPAVTATRQILAESDFTYLGKYLLNQDNDTPFGLGLSHRYVSGSFRYLWLRWQGSSSTPRYRPEELSLPAGGFDDTIDSGDITNSWSNLWDSALSAADSHIGMRWEEANSRLWVSQAWDYPQGDVSTSETSALTTCTLPGGGGDVTTSGWWGFEGVGQRAINGPVEPVPSWFQSANSTGPYVSLSGGYTSLMAQGLGPSLGPFFMFFPTLHGVYTGTGFLDAHNVPASVIKIGADCRSGATNVSDWYTDYNGRAFDRGVRGESVVIDWFENDTRSNPGSAPTYPTDIVADPQWGIFPSGGAVPNDPNGYGRWAWGDRYEGGFWCDNDAGTQEKHGICMVASLASGAAYYGNSTLNYAGREVELHIYDPDDVAACIAGSLAAYKVRPTHAFKLTLPGLPTGSSSGFGSPRPSGCTYDPTTKRLHIMVQGYDTFVAAIYVFELNTEA